GRSAYDPLERVPLPDQPEESQSQHPSHEQTTPQDERQRRESRNLCEQSVDRYVQDYDDTGHPRNLTSQELSRRSRRAQNEVLAIAGVIQRPDQRYQESTAYLVAASDVAELQGSFEETDNDAAAGLAIIMPNLLISTWFQRRVYRFYSGASYLEILQAEWGTLRPLNLLFGSVKGDILDFIPVSAVISAIGHCLSKYHIIPGISPIKSPLSRSVSTRVAAIIKFSVLTFYSLVTASLQMHSALRLLGLLPLKPAPPSFVASVSFTFTSLISSIHLPRRLTISSGSRSLASLATTPLVLYYLLDIATQEIAIRTLRYISLALPKPDNPDDFSVAVALLRNEDADVIGGLDFFMIEETDEIKKDAHTMRERAQTDWAYVRNRLSSFVSHCRSLIGQDLTPSVSTHGNQQVDTNQPQLTSHRHSGQDRQSIERRNESTTSEDSPPGPLDSGTDNQGVVHDRHSTYVHWTPEIRRNLETYQHDVYDGTRPTHRVTHLTASMSTMMAVCLSTTFAHVVCLPLETIFLRSVALAYLDTTLGTPWASGLRKEIYPMASWFGMGLRGGRMDGT
ncbi:MAG: hypothetical protein LQ341_006655, partial [Variospora aurantia]